MNREEYIERLERLASRYIIAARARCTRTAAARLREMTSIIAEESCVSKEEAEGMANVIIKQENNKFKIK